MVATPTDLDTGTFLPAASVSSAPLKAGSRVSAKVSLINFGGLTLALAAGSDDISLAWPQAGIVTAGVAASSISRIVFFTASPPISGRPAPAKSRRRQKPGRPPGGYRRRRGCLSGPAGRP